MAPDAKDCESVRLNVEEVPVHHGRRILPGEPKPAVAWTENEDDKQSDNTNSPGENRRLLPSQPPPKHKSRLQAGLTLGVHPSGKYIKCPQVQEKKKAISKFEKRKQKLITSLKPPYFILFVIVLIVVVHVCDTERVRSTLEWSPAAWLQEPWRVFTYGLVHANVPHLTLNAIVALAVGWPLESEQRWWRVLFVWCGGLVAGALGAGIMQPNVRVVGASAAVYALLTSHLANVCFRYGHVPLWWFRPLSVVVLGTSELCWALIREAPMEEVQAAAPAATTQEYVAWSAHILGAAVGVPLAFLVFTGENYNKSFVVACRTISGLLLIVAIVLTTLHYTQYSEEEEHIPWYMRSNQT
ncbi:unnamed protein product [Arctia plantaginis]|uniref:Peptidase S54 rhomboid domain-containing protein n=1 Tax=Arctia plantaginis TaxID=874455 RepID=A0A8S1AYI5_ARCPL|nr:unnamed protein product [Arctia plantaginis]